MFGLVPLHFFIVVKVYLNQGKPYLILGLFHLVCSNFDHKPNDGVMTIFLFIPFFKQQNLKFKTSRKLSTYMHMEFFLFTWFLLYPKKNNATQKSLIFIYPWFTFPCFQAFILVVKNLHLMKHQSPHLVLELQLSKDVRWVPKTRILLPLPSQLPPPPCFPPSSTSFEAFNHLLLRPPIFFLQKW